MMSGDIGVEKPFRRTRLATMDNGLRPIRQLGLTLAVILVAASCAGAATDDVAPFEDIAVAGPVVVSDLSGTAAVLTVETSIDAVCAVAYGEDAPMGNIATDREMESGGHSEHRVVVSGLQPDTEYQYRLQGVGADGRLYRSEIFSFTTPEASASDLRPNLAVGAAVVDVSSEFSESFRAGNAVDGDLGTEWSSRGDGDEAYITIDLGASAEVRAVAFRTREMSDGTAITRTFTVTVDDGEALGPFPAGANPTEVSFTGKVLRFDVDESTGGNTGAVEIEVFGAP